MVTYSPVSASFLLVLIPLLAGMLFHTATTFVATGLSSAAVIAVGRYHHGWSWGSVELVLPVLLVLLASISSWLSLRNVKTALDWAWGNYRQALRSQEQLRERQEELKRTLKALDEASYRIRNMNHELGLASERAEEARRLKQQFAANISHELRTPLSLIVGFSEMMFLSPESYDGTPLPAVYRGDVDAIYRSGQHLLSLIDDVLDLSQIEAGRMVLARETVSLREVVDEAADIMDSFMAAKGLTLGVEMPDGSLMLYADRTRLRQVLLNLLNNSCRFTDEGGVVVRTEVDQAQVIVSVEDTGVGIPQERIRHIFEEFYPLEDGSTTRHGGRGLGLPLSKRFVELHGGRMWVESQVGKGSTFRFSLPLSEHRTGRGHVATRFGARLTPFPVPLEASFLVLDSDPAVTRLLQRHIEGYQAIEARSRSEVLRLIDEHHPRAIITGASPRPEEEGEPSMKDTLYDVPLITCQLLDKPWTRLALSADNYLIKPITRERLFRALDRIEGDVENVLIVDDTPSMVRLLERMLRSRGQRYSIQKAYDGQQALALMDRERPDVVLLDLMMPGIDGPGLLRIMRDRTDLADLPVIVITVREYLQELLSSGESVHVKRKGGFSAIELVSCMKAILDSLPSQQVSGAIDPAQPTAPLG
jgi:signal transduction histidine kinase/CheY-like chemotaxis protein